MIASDAMALALVECKRPDDARVNAPYCGVISRSEIKPIEITKKQFATANKILLVSSIDRQIARIVTPSNAKIPNEPT